MATESGSAPMATADSSPPVMPPASPDELAQQAYTLLAQQERPSRDTASLACVEELLNRCPGSDDPSLESRTRALIGTAWIRAGRPDRGLAYLNGSWQQADPAIAGLAGTALLSIGQIGPALGALSQAAKEQGVDPAIRINLGRALLLSGFREEALSHLEHGAAALPGNTLAVLAVAEALLALERVEEALDRIPEDSDHEDLLAARVQLLGAASRHGEAANLLARGRERQPDSQPLLLLSAELAEVRGRSSEATAMLLKALEKDPDNIPLLCRLAHCGRRGERSPLARQAAERALHCAEDKPPHLRAVALSAHGHVLAEEGETAEAEATYRQALELAPALPAALSGLGQLLLQTGKVEEAMACFQQVRAIAPLQGWSQLIHAREVPDDPQVLDNLEKAARQPGLEGPLRAGLLYTVAAAWDKKKEHERAMALAHQANEASKTLLDYNPSAHRQRVEREIGRYSPAFLASRQGWGDPSRLPVFVLGMPRSGTTLTEQILGSHSQVFGAGELGLVGEQIAKLEGWELKLGSGLAYPECVADLSRERSAKLAAAWLEQLQQLAPDARHVVDKLPHNFEHIGLIKLLFPNATIIHCQREPRDVAVSNYITDYAAKFGGMGFAYDLTWIGEQLVDHQRLMQHWHAVFPGQIVEVAYEDLVDDPETHARRMIAALGLEWEPGVLEFQSLERSVKTASVWQVRQPVYKTSKARWKRYAAHLGPLEEALAVVPPLPEPAPLPMAEPGLFGEAMAHMQAQCWSGAETAFLQVIAAYPQHAAAYQFLGGALLQQGKSDKAVRAMRQSIQLLPLHPSWWENLARAEHSAGNAAAAQQAWARGQQLRQRQAEADRASSLPTLTAT